MENSLNSSQETSLNPLENNPGPSSDQSTNITDEGKRYRRFQKNRLFKRNILRRLKTIGPDPQNFQTFINHPGGAWNNVNPHDISRYLIDFARKSQQAVEIQTPELETLHKLCDALCTKENTVGKTTEIPLALEAITNLEHSPSQGHSDSVNLAQIYKTMSDLMKGFPVQEMTPANKDAVHEAVQEVLDIVNGPQGRDDLKMLNEFLLTGRHSALPKDQLQELRGIFSGGSINPLELPIEFVVNKIE